MDEAYTLSWWIRLLRECQVNILFYKIDSKEAYRYTVLSDWIAERIVKHYG